MRKDTRLTGGLYQGADALCTQYLANLAPIFVNADRLQIGAECSRRSLLGPRPITAKARFLAAMFAFCHFRTSFRVPPGGLQLRRDAFQASQGTGQPENIHF